MKSTENKEINPFDIDLGRLEQEWCEHPGRFYEAAVRLADARREYDEAKRQLDVAEAVAERNVRKDPASYGIEKLTESAVKCAVTLDSRVATAHHAVIQAKHDAAIFEAAVSALEHRKKALEGDVSLLIGGFFAAPREPRNSAGAVDQLRQDRAFKRKKS